MTLELRPEIADGLTALATAHGLSVEEYLRQLVERELPVVAGSDTPATEESGMVWENGLLIYGAGTALPDHVIDDAIRRSREERAQHILGIRS